MRTFRSDISWPIDAPCDQYSSGMHEEPYGLCILAGMGVDIQARNKVDLCVVFDGIKPPIRMEEYAPNDVIFTFFEIPKFPLTTLFAIVRSAVPVTTKCQFIRADPASRPSSGVHMLNTTSPLVAFRLDFTSFSACYFADFFEGELP